MKRALAIFVSFAVGWLIYMVAMALTVYDGIVSLILQPVLAVLCSGLFVLAALLVGLVLKIPVLSRWWRGTRMWATALILVSLFILCWGSWLGVTHIYTDHETGREFTGLHPAVALVGYFAIIFALCNWPIQNDDVEPNAAPISR